MVDALGNVSAPDVSQNQPHCRRLARGLGVRAATARRYIKAVHKATTCPGDPQVSGPVTVMR